MMSLESLSELLRCELIQLREEGFDTSGLADRLVSTCRHCEISLIYDESRTLAMREDFNYVEPSDISQIVASRTGTPKIWQQESDYRLLDKIKGAWLGRAAGCMLGKPVEGWSSEEIRSYLQFVSGYPLTDYVTLPSAPVPDGVRHPNTDACRGQWNSGVVDDDINYTILALHIAERFGEGFTTSDVGTAWLDTLPYNQMYTAEIRTYANLVNEVPSEITAEHRNPYREWIGAQIRADFWGYVAPGNPGRAAGLAYRDAAISHRKNGIYGAMFCAAAVSAALATENIFEIVESGLSVIPPRSRLAETARDCLRWRLECSSWEQAFDRMRVTDYGGYHWAHTNNNLAIVLIALLFGWPDFEHVVTYAVMQGMDTDCNGATAGSIVGAAFGAVSLPSKWTGSLNGTLRTSLAGVSECYVDDLAARTLRQVDVFSGRS